MHNGTRRHRLPGPNAAYDFRDVRDQGNRRTEETRGGGETLQRVRTGPGGASSGTARCGLRGGAPFFARPISVSRRPTLISLSRPRGGTSVASGITCLRRGQHGKRNCAASSIFLIAPPCRPAHARTGRRAPPRSFCQYRRRRGHDGRTPAEHPLQLHPCTPTTSSVTICS